MKNRRSVMTVSALFILFFHLWVNLLTRNQVEMFLRQTAYLGVDMFFFLSAYALSQREVTNYRAFLWSRFQSVYVKFLLFAVVAFFYSGWKFSKLWKVAIGWELFQKGGGAFLWFLPAIMLFYLVLPFFQKLDHKNRVVAVIASLGIWFFVGLLVTSFSDYKAMFIFWNRIPIVILGFYAAKWLPGKPFWEKKWQKALAGILLLAVGSVLTFTFGYRGSLQVPLYDMFYVAVIPSALGLILLADLIPENKVIKWIGSSTLEIYGFQMVFGFRFCIYISKVVRGFKLPKFWGSFLTNLITFVFIIAASVLIRIAYEKMIQKVWQRKK